MLLLLDIALGKRCCVVALVAPSPGCNTLHRTARQGQSFSALHGDSPALPLCGQLGISVQGLDFWMVHVKSRSHV